MRSRRSFVKTMAAAGALCSLSPASLFASPLKRKIGIQLYTIRDLVEKDITGSFQKLSEIGYSSIETAGYRDGKFYGYAPADFKELAGKFGLDPQSSHSGLSVENIDRVADDTLEAGMKYLVQPSIPQEKRKTLDDYKKIADELNAMGEVCASKGLVLGYHNHAFEFEIMDGQVPYDVLLSQTEPKLVTMQLDTYWMIYGKYSPGDYFNKYPGRFRMWHVKDMAASESRESTEIGSGIIDFPALFKMQEQAGMECIFVEQEEFTMDPWESLKLSWQYLNNLYH